jgi:hypothetical protein
MYRHLILKPGKSEKLIEQPGRIIGKLARNINNMELIKVADLKEYAINSVITTISQSEYKRLKDDLKRDGQLENMFVMRDDDIKLNNTVLGGNKRLKAMTEMGWYEAKCNIVIFKSENEGWCAYLDGEPQRSRFFKSKEAAMLYYSVKHNDNKYGTYNKEQLMTYMDAMELPYEEVHVMVEEVPSFAEVINASVNVDKVAESEEKAEKKLKEVDIICPFCKKEFKKEI